MPKFEPDFESTSVNTLVMPKGDYEVELGKPVGMANYKKDEDGNATEDISAGVSYPVKLIGKINSRGVTEDVDGSGEQLSFVRLYVHNAGSLKSTKRFLMGVLGYDKKQEDEFNAWYRTQDFGVDTGEADDDGKFTEVQIGDAWGTLTGMHARVTLDKRTWNDEEQQEFKSWKSAKQGASV